MIIVFLEKPSKDGAMYDSYFYKNKEELEADINLGNFCFDVGDSLFLAEMPVLKEYIYKAALVEKKSKK